MVQTAVDMRIAQDIVRPVTTKAIARASMAQIALGALPYVGLLILGLALVLVWPDIALWLPSRTLNLK